MLESVISAEPHSFTFTILDQFVILQILQLNNWFILLWHPDLITATLLNGVPGYKLKHIQRMQNIAARIVSRCPYRDHITPVLESLHWLPVKYWILFKLLLLTYKCLNGLGPGYLSCLVMPRKHRYEPRPQHQGQLQVPQARLKSYG